MIQIFHKVGSTDIVLDVDANNKSGQQDCDLAYYV